MFAVLASVMRSDPDGLFGDDPVVLHQLPQMRRAPHDYGARNALEAYIGEKVKTTIADDYALRFRRHRRGSTARLAWKSCARLGVCVVGVGGVGSWTVEALARSGLGALTLIDLDDVCVTNVNRQPSSALDGNIGRPKVDALAEPRAGSSSSGVQHHGDYRVFYRRERPRISPGPDGYDFVVDAIDALARTNACSSPPAASADCLS